MKKYRVVLSNEAVNDLNEAYVWYDLQRPYLGYEFELSIEAIIQQLSRNPLEIQKKYKSIRVAYTSRFPFGVHYFIDNELVKVIGIFHTNRSPKSWAKRK